MKILLFIFLPFAVASQSNKDLDSLKQYSYRTFGYYERPAENGKDTGTGSCGGTVFFVKKYEHIFLITAKHVLTGCEDEGKPKLFCDRLFIITNKTGRPELSYIDTKQYRDTSACGIPDSIPDFAVIDVTDAVPKDIKCVNDFILPRFKVLRNAYIIGYPSTSITEPFKLKQIPASSFELIDGGYSFFRYEGNNKKVSPPHMFWVDAKKSEFPDSLFGYSGSPLFVRDALTNNWRIGGIFTVTTKPPQSHILGFVTFETAMDYIDQNFKPRLSN